MELSNEKQQIGNILSDKEEKILEILTELIQIKGGGNFTLSNIEQTTTNIFNTLRKESLNRISQENDPKECLCPCCGTKMKIVAKKKIRIIGLVTYALNPRYFNCPKCNRYERPLLKILDCTSGFTAEIKEYIVLLGQRIPFNEASIWLKQLLKVEVSHETIQEITENIGKEVHNEEVKQIDKLIDKDGNIKPKYRKEWASNIPKIDDTAYMQLDGSMVQTREDGWKEVKSGILFTESSKMQPDKNHIMLNRKDYFSTFDKVDIFKKRAASAAYDFRFHLYKNQAGLGDGAPWIWDYYDKYHPEATQILDYFHASEYLGNAFVSLEWEKTEENSAIKEKLFTWLHEGEINKIIQYLIYTKQTTEIKNCIRYFENNISRMNYGEYRRKGFNIGSGAIESAHRTIIQCRMKLSGMYWGKANVQSIISLRSAYLSGKWEKNIKKLFKKAA
jgi:hypothetical protein